MYFYFLYLFLFIVYVGPFVFYYVTKKGGRIESLATTLRALVTLHPSPPHHPP
jgi:hypothetical protein